jgi:uncharacterized protein (UPF0332 family)
VNEQANREYIAYRLNRSQESLEEARLLADNRHLAGAINRIYYAMFYAVSALALSHGFSTSSHAQLRGYFNREFVRTGRVSIDLGRAFGTAFDSRSKGDYDDLVQFDAEQVSVMLVEAQQFVHTVSRLVVNP